MRKSDVAQVLSKKSIGPTSAYTLHRLHKGPIWGQGAKADMSITSWPSGETCEKISHYGETGEMQIRSVVYLVNSVEPMTIS